MKQKLNHIFFFLMFVEGIVLFMLLPSFSFAQQTADVVPPEQTSSQAFSKKEKTSLQNSKQSLSENKKIKPNKKKDEKDQEHYKLYRSFNEGFILTIRANFLGSVTMPRINQTDLNTLKSASLIGGVGFVVDSEIELGYLFSKEKWFSRSKSKTLSGMGFSVTLGVGQAFVAKKLSGSYSDAGTQKTFNLYLTTQHLPAITFGIAHRLYFFYNRLAIGLWLGGKSLVDNSPTFYFYSNDSTKFPTTVGNLIISEDVRKKINSTMFSLKGFIEYYQPIVNKMQMVIRLYAGYNVFKPNYIILPSAIKTDFNTSQELSSLYLDSVEMGLSVALAFKT